MAIHVEFHRKVGGLLKEAVFGFNDGVVSTFAVIAGLTGGAIENKTVLLAALATLVAGAFSMGLGTYLGSKSEKDHYESELARENWEIDNMPEAEIQEIRDIYSAKGFKGKLLDDVVAKITSDRDVWLKTMMTDELGFAEAPPKPGLNGIIMSVSFIVGSFIPTLPYFFQESYFESIFRIAMILSAIGLLAVGGLKTRFTKRNVIISALETLIVGALAAGGSYGIGVLLT
ncbi:VIT1/CCC1 transporter family protein [Candidatus Peregrinibacteria bacterium]|nr:VIT1/CCC1 transporter family protein [Candidatus Peregrinibacteria bacterium]